MCSSSPETQCFCSLSRQNLLPRVPEADQLRPAPGERSRHRILRDGAALQRHQGAPAHGQKGRGAPGAA